MQVWCVLHLLITIGDMSPGAYFNIKTIFPGMEISMVYCKTAVAPAHWQCRYYSLC